MGDFKVKLSEGVEFGLYEGESVCNGRNKVECSEGVEFCESQEASMKDNLQSILSRIASYANTYHQELEYRNMTEKELMCVCDAIQHHLSEWVGSFMSLAMDIQRSLEVNDDIS